MELRRGAPAFTGSNPRTPASSPRRAGAEPSAPDLAGGAKLEERRSPEKALKEPPSEEERVLAQLQAEKAAQRRPRTREEIREEVEDYIRRLRADEESAQEAYLELWEVDKELIPALIEHTEDPEKSGLRELAVLVLEPQRFFRQDKDGVPIYTIPGLGAFELDDIAAGKARRGAKAVIRNFERFPVGVVVRAALVNRFRSRDYPSGDDQRDLKGWWRRYYQRVRPNL